jgi:hypothetical protein
LVRAIAAFNALDAEEQELFAERLALMFDNSGHVEKDPFWMDRADDRRCLTRCWRALPVADRRAFTPRVSGGGRRA